MTRTPPTPSARSSRRSVLMTLPLIAFTVLFAMFWVRLGSDPSKIPSALIGRPALVAAVRARGLLLEKGGRVETVPLAASTDPAAVAGAMGA